jgi:proteasome lid subunit RPN8/RPN11
VHKPIKIERGARLALEAEQAVANTTGERCGALLGERVGERVTIMAIEPLPNLRRLTGFAISHRDLAELESNKGDQVIGIYHTHTGDAVPSLEDVGGVERIVNWIYVIAGYANGNSDLQSFITAPGQLLPIASEE